MRKYVRDFLDLDDEDLTDSVFDGFILDATTRVIEKDRRWPFLEVVSDFTAIAGVDSYSLADVLPEFEDIVKVGRLDWIDHSAGDDYGPSGIVQAYSTWGGRLYLHPTPTAAQQFEVQGYRSVGDWTQGGATATPPFPAEFHMLLVKWALSCAYAQQDDPELASFHAAQFMEQLNVLWRARLAAPSHTPLIVGGGRRRPHWPETLRFPWEA